MSFAFYIREKFRWTGLPYIEQKTAHSLRMTDRGRTLFTHYDLSRYQDWIDQDTLDEVMGTLDLLDHIPKKYIQQIQENSKTSSLKVLDIGSKNWRYLGALASWMNFNFRNKFIETHGVEIDAYRLYSNLRTRIVYANYFAKKCTTSHQCFEYHPKDVSLIQDKFNLMTWFFPFVSPNPHLKWGLPRVLFKPRFLFDHVASSLLPGGIVILVNQGEWEWEMTRALAKDLKLIFNHVLEGSLHPSPYPIFLSVWERNL